MYRLTVLWLLITLAAFLAGYWHATRHDRIATAQIRELLAAARSSVERDDCKVALGELQPRVGDTRHRARVRCAWLYQTATERGQIGRAS